MQEERNVTLATIILGCYLRSDYAPIAGMHVNTERCAAYPVSRVRWVDGVAGQVGGWWEGLLGHKT